MRGSRQKNRSLVRWMDEASVFKNTLCASFLVWSKGVAGRVHIGVAANGLVAGAGVSTAAVKGRREENKWWREFSTFVAPLARV
jgi:hypothetical protein